MYRFIAFLCLIVSATQMAAAADEAAGNALRTALAGKTVHVETAIGTVPVNFRPDGTMSGRSTGLAAYAMASADQGRWWVIGDRLCQQWAKWFSNSTRCFSMRRDGRKLYWTGNGHSGVATIAN